MPLQTQWFKDWFNSPYYHKLYFEHNEQEAKKFINELMVHLRPKTGSLMLDVACGRGRHAKLLSEKGFDVTGVVTEVDLKFPEINDACDCIQACLNRPTTCASWVWKFSTADSVMAGHRTCTLCTHSTSILPFPSRIDHPKQY